MSCGLRDLLAGSQLAATLDRALIFAPGLFPPFPLREEGGPFVLKKRPCFVEGCTTGGQQSQLRLETDSNRHLAIRCGVDSEALLLVHCEKKYGINMWTSTHGLKCIELKTPRDQLSQLLKQSADEKSDVMKMLMGGAASHSPPPQSPI